MTRIAWLATIVWLAAGVSNGDDQGNWCATKTTLAGPCIVVHGRLQQANGNPSVRVWPVGTKRVLGLAGEEGAELIPAGLVASLGHDVVVYGDFRVCPVTKAIAGVMQTVCVEAGAVLVRVATTKKGRTVARLPDVSAPQE